MLCVTDRKEKKEKTGREIRLEMVTLINVAAQRALSPSSQGSLGRASSYPAREKAHMVRELYDSKPCEEGSCYPHCPTTLYPQPR